MCPLCSLPVEITADMSKDACIDSHISSGCQTGIKVASKRGNGPVCVVPRCRERMLLLSCGGCEVRTTVCVFVVLALIAVRKTECCLCEASRG